VLKLPPKTPTPTFDETCAMLLRSDDADTAKHDDPPTETTIPTTKEN
jgi:hypothetical protein